MLLILLDPLQFSFASSCFCTLIESQTSALPCWLARYKRRHLGQYYDYHCRIKQQQQLQQ